MDNLNDSTGHQNTVRVSLIGSNSRLGRAILQRTRGNVRFRCLSRTRAEENGHDLIQGDVLDADKLADAVQGADSVVFLAGFPGAPSSLSQLEEILIGNAFTLALVVRCMERTMKRAKLVFVSSAHVYQLAADHIDVYAEHNLELKQGLDRWVSDTACFMLEHANTCQRSPGQYRQAMSLYLSDNPLPLSQLPAGENGYRFLYEISKVVGERILQGVESYAILRPTYCYGYTDTANRVYQMIDGFFRRRTVHLPAQTVDFVFYDDLVETLSACWGRSDSDRVVINVASGDPVSPGRMHTRFKALERELGIASTVYREPGKRKALNVCNKKLRQVLNRICTRNITGFDDGFDQVLFRYVSEQILGLRIVQEYEGGSTARVYLVNRDNGGDGILKIGLGNRAENGARKIQNEIRQLVSVRDSFPHGIPEVWQKRCTDYLSYALIQRIGGPSVSDLILSGRMGPREIIKTVNDVQTLLLQTYRLRTVPAPASFVHDHYCKRPVRRLTGLAQVSDETTRTLLSCVQQPLLTINGVVYKNPITILNDLELNWLSADRLGFCISGDLILDNVLLDSGQYFFVDPRGDVFWQDGVPFFDPVYDLAKMFFYFAGWKLIRLEQFVLDHSMSAGHDEFRLAMTGPHATIFRQVQREFLPLMIENCSDCDPQLLGPHYLRRYHLAVAAHFLSDTLPRVMGKGTHRTDQAIAEYLIGTMILNEFSETIGRMGTGASIEVTGMGVWENE